MMSLPKLSDSKKFSPHSSSAERADEDESETGGSKPSNTSSSALSEADGEGPAVADTVRNKQNTSRHRICEFFLP